MNVQLKKSEEVWDIMSTGDVLQIQQKQPGLKHLSYLCPGLHDKDSRQDIQRRTFGGFLPENKRILIPLFQRRYCWFDVRIHGWWQDTLGGKRDHLGIHNSGNVIVKRSQFDNDSLIVIDGQQRITTTTLLLASLRDALLREIKDLGMEDPIRKEGRSGVKKAEIMLYNDVKAKTEWVKKVNEGSHDVFKNDGEDLSFCRLLPSFTDRKAYFQLIMEGLLDNAVSSDEMTFQCKAKKYFDQQISVTLKFKGGDSTSRRIALLNDWLDLALEKMGLTVVHILNDIDMPQVFLWLQEKSLFGEGGLLFNPSPGIAFTAGDLVRNLLLSPIMNETFEKQETFYRENWLIPIELKVKDTDELNKAMAAFLEKAPTNDDSYTSSMETQVMAYMKHIEKSKQASVVTYAKFYSFFEQRVKSKQMAPPPSPTAGEEQRKRSKKEEEVLITPLTSRQACLEILAELKGFINRYDVQKKE